MAVFLRREFDASRLRGLAKRTKDGPQARRLLALAAIYDGATRTEAAKIGGVGLQIIRDWVLRYLLRPYANYYNQNRTHLSLNKDTPTSGAIQTTGRILSLPILGGLHHQYVRI